MKCKNCGDEIKDNVTYHLEGYEVTHPEIATTYDYAKKLCSEGFRLPKRWELFKIMEDKENRKKLSDSGYMFFWSSTIEGNFVKGLILYNDLDLYSDNGNLADSNGFGRVVFIKEIK